MEKNRVPRFRVWISPSERPALWRDNGEAYMMYWRPLRALHEEFAKEVLDELCHKLNTEAWPVWVNVEYALPEDLTSVLVYVKTRGGFGYVERGMYYSNGNCFEVDGEYPNVTHWMPLPEPPTRESPAICPLGCFEQSVRRTGYNYCPYCGRKLDE